MKKIIGLLLFIMIVFNAFTQELNDCVYCNSNTVNQAGFASGIGTNNTATGLRSFVGGENSSAAGSYAMAFGFQTKALGPSTIALGYKAQANGMYSAAIGRESIVNGDGSFAFGLSNIAQAGSSYLLGELLKSNASGSIILGIGATINQPLENTKANSMMIGFKSIYPTLYVQGQSSLNNDKTGRVGIGNITDPQVKLHILSDEGEAAELKLEYRSTGINQVARIYLGTQAIEAGNSNMTFNTTSASKHFVFQNGSLRSIDGSATTPAYSFSSSPNTGIFRPSSNILAFSTSGAERLRINGTGVGIGTTSPSEKLHVEGFARTSSGYKVGAELVINTNRDYSGGNGSFSGVLNVTGTGNSSITGNLGIGVSAPTEKLDIVGFAKTSSGYKVGANQVIDVNRNFSGNNAVFGGTLNVTGIASFAGNVGIGNTSPQKKLDVAGDINFTGTLFQNGTPVNFQNPWMVNGDKIYYNNGNVGIGISTPGAQLDIADTGAPGSINLKVGNDAYLSDVDQAHTLGILSCTNNNVGVLRLGLGGPELYGNENGCLGIGTSSPASKLDVRGTTTLDYNQGNTPGSALIVRSGADQLKIMDSGDGDYGIFGNEAENTYLKSYTSSGTECAAIFLNKNGNVGISTPNPSPDYKLSVAGKILAEELQIQLVQDWYDNVFEGSYNLMDLNELESFVRQNNHLPDIPSEAEVKGNGINVGEMNALLLKKVEELTLYIIEQQKLLEKQNARIDDLKALVESKNNE